MDKFPSRCSPLVSNRLHLKVPFGAFGALQPRAVFQIILVEGLHWTRLEDPSASPSDGLRGIRGPNSRLVRAKAMGWGVRYCKGRIGRYITGLHSQGYSSLRHNVG